MSNAPFADASQGQWFYSYGGQPTGPVTCQVLRSWLQARQVTPDIMVWRQGMPNWLPARLVPELVVGMSLPPSGTPMALPRNPEDVTRSNAMVNCIVMFVFFLLSLAHLASVTVLRLFHWRDLFSLLAGLLCVAAQGFALVYLPLRWKRLRQMPPVIRTLGIIGGVGLIILLVLYAVGVILSVTGHAPRHLRWR